MQRYVNTVNTVIQLIVTTLNVISLVRYLHTAKQGQESLLQCRRILTTSVGALRSLGISKSEMIATPVSGLIPRAIVHIFEGKEAEEDDETLFDVRVSYIEIYNEEMRDLGAPSQAQRLHQGESNRLQIKEDAVQGIKVHAALNFNSLCLLAVAVAVFCPLINQWPCFCRSQGCMRRW